MKVLVILILAIFTHEAHACYGHTYKCKQFLENLFKNSDVQFNNDLSVDTRYQNSSSEDGSTTKSGYKIRTAYTNIGSTRFPARIEVAKGQEKKTIRLNYDASGSCSVGEVHNEVDQKRRLIFKSDALCADLIELEKKGITFEENPPAVGNKLRKHHVTKDEIGRSVKSEGLRLLANCKALAIYSRSGAGSPGLKDTTAHH